MPGTVVVACKLPHGLILRNHKLVDGTEPVFGGGTRPIKVAVMDGHPVQINGAAYELNTTPEHPVIGGYALTFGVDADFMAQWLKDNLDLDMVRNELIKVHEKPEVVEKMARERKALRSGLEPGQPDKALRGIKKAQAD